MSNTASMTGASVGKPVPEEAVGEVLGAIDRVDQVEGELSELLYVLRDRLQGVMYPANPECCESAAGEAKAMPPVAERLHCTANRIEFRIGLVREILRRLSI